MITYSREEIISSSKTAKNLGSVLSNLRTGKLSRAVISKNNKLEAVILPIEEYEIIKEAYELMEHIEIYKLLEERKGSDKQGTSITLDELLKEEGISRDGL